MLSQAQILYVTSKTMNERKVPTIQENTSTMFPMGHAQTKISGKEKVSSDNFSETRIEATGTVNIMWQGE